MKKTLFSVLTFLMLLSNTQIQASACDIPCCEKKSYYAEIFGGANFLQIPNKYRPLAEFNTGYAVCGQLGYRFYDLRLEAEIAFRHNSLDKTIRNSSDFDDYILASAVKLKGRMQTTSYMVNLLWDLPLCRWGMNLWNIQPFIGAGVGYDVSQIKLRLHHLPIRAKEHHFAWQFMAGLNYPIFQDTELSIEYKLHRGNSDRVYSHAIGLGLKYNFNFF